MKKTVLILCISLLCQLAAGQTDSSDYKDHSLYLYRTEDDFFNKKKTYRGQILPSEDKKIIKYAIGSKKRTLNLQDSCTHYFAYEVGGEIQVRPGKDPYNFTYYTFGGGTRDVYCVVYGYLPNYDRKGYLLGLTSPTSAPLIYFVDHVNKLSMVSLSEFLKSKPALLERYKAQKQKTDKAEWERNRLAICIKYLKLFIGEK